MRLQPPANLYALAVMRGCFLLGVFWVLTLSADDPRSCVSL